MTFDRFGQKAARAAKLGAGLAAAAAMVGPAFALPMAPALSASASTAHVVDVQYYRHGGYYGRFGHRYGYRDYGRYGRGYYGRRYGYGGPGVGAAVGAGLAGAAVGAAIGSAIAR